MQRTSGTGALGLTNKNSLESVMGKISYILFFATCLCWLGGFKTEYPKGYFQHPVAAPLRLSGTFGELRPNHFHAGIDIKGAIGTPIYAAAEGFISKIVVSPDSYGNHLYIQHPNGYTTLYAHLESFSAGVRQFVLGQQRDAETFELTLRPVPGQFEVKKGDLVGFMGNSGHSFGPHLHFEIRETATNKPHNPLLFGYKVADAIPPRLHELKVYEMDEQMNIVGSRILPLVFKNGKYRLPTDTITVNTAQFGMAIKAYDHMDGVSNWNGIYALDLFDGDELLYGFRMDAIGQDESRFLNAHIDYLEQRNRGSYFHRCFKLPGNFLSIYTSEKTGWLSVGPGEIKNLEFAVSDIAGNTAKAVLNIRRGVSERNFAPGNVPYQFFWPYDRSHQIEDFRLYVHLPKGVLYENALIRYGTKPPATGQFSYMHSFQPDDIPLHRAFSLGLRAEGVPQNLKARAFIAQVSKGSVTNWGGQWQDDGMLVAPVRSLGDFCVMLDTVPPRVQLERFYPDMRRYSTMSFKISDNVSASINLPNLRFKAFIDGRWAMFVYDEKNRRIQHTFEETLGKGTHQLRLEVMDAMGNIAVFERDFLR
jgi:murein DD-endopeptidase MepM/ murein hydrolase activator NlpD